MEQIDNITVKYINLDSRPERLAQIEREIQKASLHNYIGITSYVHHVATFDPLQGGERGCALSHFACLKGSGPLLILEDDAVFTRNAGAILQKAVSQLPDDFDILYLGANVKAPATRFSDNLFKISRGAHCTHAMLYSSKGRKRMQDLWNPQFEHRDPIDHWLATEGQRQMNCYVCSPIIAFQRGGVSDVHWKKQFMDYKKEMQANEKLNMQ